MLIVQHVPSFPVPPWVEKAVLFTIGGPVFLDNFLLSRKSLEIFHAISSSLKCFVVDDSQADNYQIPDTLADEFRLQNSHPLNCNVP